MQKLISVRLETLGVGLVAFKSDPSQIELLSKSLRFFKLAYKVVIDNSPSPALKEIFESNGWTYLHNKKNPGFGTSHNRIFDCYGHLADFHLVVNPDVYFDQQVITRIVDFFNKVSDAGCVAPTVKYPDGRYQGLSKLLPRPIDLLINKFPFLNILNFRTEGFIINNENIPGSYFKAPFVSGCFLMFRSSIIREIGFFDTRFFLYAEDLDLSRRLWHSGNYPYVLKDTIIVHGYDRQSSRSLRLLWVHIVSVFKYFNKWGWFDKGVDSVNSAFYNQFE